MCMDPYFIKNPDVVFGDLIVMLGPSGDKFQSNDYF